MKHTGDPLQGCPFFFPPTFIGANSQPLLPFLVLFPMELKTIVITGPESCGKTTLTAQLAETFNTNWIPEFARAYIDKLTRPYNESDLVKIAKGQVEAENKLIQNSKLPVFLDTSLEVIKIWSEYKYRL